MLTGVSEVVIQGFSPIRGFEDGYLINKLGVIYSLKRNKFLKPMGCGRKQCYLGVDIGGKSRLIHCLVAKTFIPNPENKPFVNHKDGIKTNNNVDNLEWVTASENSRHAYNTGLISFNKKARENANKVNRKLTYEQVIVIRELYNKKYTQKELAVIFCVNQSIISRIINFRAYREEK